MAVFANHPRVPTAPPAKAIISPVLCLSILTQRPGSAATFRSPTVAHKPERGNAMRRMRLGGFGVRGVRTWGVVAKVRNRLGGAEPVETLAGRSCSPLVPMPRRGHEMGAAWCKSWWLSPNHLHWRAPSTQPRIAGQGCLVRASAEVSDVTLDRGHLRLQRANLARRKTPSIEQPSAIAPAPIDSHNPRHGHRRVRSSLQVRAGPSS